MPKRDWGISGALGIILVIALTWTLGQWAGAYYQQKWQAEHDQKSDPSLDAPEPGTFWFGRRGDDPRVYEAICDQPANDIQADLCQQWRSANKAEEIAGYTLVSIFIGLGGLLGLWKTVTYARQAATTAAETLNETRLSNERQLRAYVTVKDMTVKNFEAGKRAEIRVTIVNTGQTPARYMQFITGSVPGHPDPLPKFFGKSLMTGRPSVIEVGAHSTYTIPIRTSLLTTAFVDMCRKGELVMMVAGYGKYFDVFGKRHCVVFKGVLAFDTEGRPDGVSPSHKNNRGN